MRILVIGATFEGCCYAHSLREQGYHVDLVDKSYYADSLNLSKEERQAELESFIQSSSFYSENRVTKLNDSLNDLLWDFDMEDNPISKDRYNRIYAYIDYEDLKIKRVFDAQPSKLIDGDIIIPDAKLERSFIDRIGSKRNPYDYELKVLSDMYRIDYLKLYERMLNSFDIINMEAYSVNNDASVLFEDGTYTRDYDTIIIATSAQTANDICGFSSNICTPLDWKKIVFPHQAMSEEFFNKCFMSDTIFFTLDNSDIIKIYSNGDFWVCVYREPKDDESLLSLINDLGVIMKDDYMFFALNNNELNKRENYAKLNSFYRQKLYDSDGHPTPIECNPFSNVCSGSVYRTPFANGIRQSIADTTLSVERFCDEL